VAHPGLTTLGDLSDLVQDSRIHKLDAIAIVLPLSQATQLGTIVVRLRSVVADVYYVSDIAGQSMAGLDAGLFGQAGTFLLRRQPISGWSAVQKAVFDYVLASVLLVVLTPVLAAIAVAIKLDSPGPVLFRQPRLGFNNRMFTTYKFRSMYHHMTDLLADQQTTRQDKRITRVGKWLRKLSLDELPQLFNVLRGEMSLVGPRPHAPNTKVADRLFTDVLAHYSWRHQVKPGITGWAQVNGWRGETTSIDQLENRVAHDLEYIEEWSIFLDAKIALMTLLREIRSKNAY
jgi:Undecaprenyl-phosphate glucose phosphotransferase